MLSHRILATLKHILNKQYLGTCNEHVWKPLLNYSWLKIDRSWSSHIIRCVGLHWFTCVWVWVCERVCVYKRTCDKTSCHSWHKSSQIVVSKFTQLNIHQECHVCTLSLHTHHRLIVAWKIKQTHYHEWQVMRRMTRGYGLCFDKYGHHYM